MKIDIHRSAAKILSRLWECGFEAFVVGGCVRDALLGMEPHDWDITTSAKPEQIIESFGNSPEFRAVATGAKHGTITVIHQGYPIEVTTYRIDGEYLDHRRPDRVEFTDSLAEDLARRDFTINAMAYAPDFGICDPFGGAKDLELGLIRCVGDASKRFSEDALRILRAIRFSATLGFLLEKETAKAAIELRGLLLHISRERISSELLKLLSGKWAYRVLKEYHPVFSKIFPTLGEHDWDKAAKTLENLPDPSTELALAALLADSNNVEGELNRLRIDKKTCRNVQNIVQRCHARSFDRVSIKRICRDVGIESAKDVILLAIARGDASFDALLVYNEIVANNECLCLSMLETDGYALKNIGVPPHLIGRILDILLDEVICGLIKNEPGALLCRAKAIFERI